MHIDLIALDAAAVRETLRLTSGITDLTRPTPCAAWDLGALLTHMAEQHRAFAAAAEGRHADPAPAPTDPVRDYAVAAELAIQAFAAPGVLDRDFILAEFSTTQAVPGRRAVGFHLVDYAVHGWDVARALDLPFVPPAALADAVLPIARAVPTGPSRLEPGAAFAPALAVPPAADPWTETLLLLGRDPTWSPGHPQENVGGCC